MTGKVISVKTQCNNANNTVMTGKYCNVVGNVTATVTGPNFYYWRQTTQTTLTLNTANGGGSYTASGTSSAYVTQNSPVNNTNQAFFDRI